MKKRFLILSLLSFILFSISSSIQAQEILFDGEGEGEEENIDIGIVFPPAKDTIECGEGFTSTRKITFYKYCSKATDRDAAKQEYIDSMVMPIIRANFVCDTCPPPVTNLICKLSFVRFIGEGIIASPSADCNGYVFRKLTVKVRVKCSSCTPAGYVTSGIQGNQIAASRNNPILISPNPASTFIKLDLQLLTPRLATTVALFDINGSLIRDIYLGNLSSGKHSQEVDISQLSTGVYFISFYSSDQLIGTERFVIE